MLTNMCFDVVRLGSTSVHSWSHHGSELKESHIGEFIVALMEPSVVRWQNIPPPPCRPPGSRVYMEQTEITMMSVRLCVSPVFLWTHILRSVKSRRTQRMVCLLCWGTIQAGLGLEASLPLALLLSHSVPGALSEFSLRPLLGFFQATLPPSLDPEMCIPPLALPEICSVRFLHKVLSAAVFLSHLEGGTNHHYLLEAGNLHGANS